MGAVAYRPRGRTAPPFYLFFVWIGLRADYECNVFHRGEGNRPRFPDAV
jgi:hypothetical protein